MGAEFVYKSTISISGSPKPMKKKLIIPWIKNSGHIIFAKFWTLLDFDEKGNLCICAVWVEIISKRRVSYTKYHLDS